MRWLIIGNAAALVAGSYVAAPFVKSLAERGEELSPPPALSLPVPTPPPPAVSPPEMTSPIVTEAAPKPPPLASVPPQMVEPTRVETVVVRDENGQPVTLVIEGYIPAEAAK